MMVIKVLYLKILPTWSFFNKHDWLEILEANNRIFENCMKYLSI